jgi:hypothetical protein
MYIEFLNVWTKVSLLIQAVHQRKAASAVRMFDARKRCARISQCDVVRRLRLEQAIQLFVSRHFFRGSDKPLTLIWQ